MNTIEKLGDEETFRQIVERSITSFTDDELMAIVEYSFYRCKELQEVSLPLITEIPGSAFSNCSSLTNVKVPKATSIRSSAFSNCSSLTNVKVPKATSIGSSAFSNCSSLSSLIVGTELEDETAICTLGNMDALPSSIGAIYVPYNLMVKYKTATNWSAFASKIQSYEVPVSCQSLTITAEDVPGYITSTKVHYEAVCTYSIEGMMQTGTKVFKNDAMSDTFGINPSGESSRQVEVSYTFLGQTATTTITQDKYLGNPVGGKIYYIDDTADGAYSFYDAEGNLLSDISVGSTPSYYKVITAGSKDKYYVYHDELYSSLRWTYYKNNNPVEADLKTGTAIGTGKSNTAKVLAADSGAYVAASAGGRSTIWYKLQQICNASTGGCNDWFIPSKDEVEALRLAIGCTTSTSGAVVVDAGAVTGGIIAGTADGKTHYMRSNGTYYCYPSATKFLNSYIWSSSESPKRNSWNWWPSSLHKWTTNEKYNDYSVFFVRAF